MGYLSPETISLISKKLTEISELLKNNEPPAPFRIDKPFSGNYAISQKFGENPQIYGPMGYAGHFGLDFLTPWGSPILATDDGVVTRCAFSAGNGNFLEIKHTWGLSLYCHFKNLPTFNQNAKITRGQIIGYAGNTGLVFSTLPANAPHRGTHLHFSIKITGRENPPYKDWIDPLPFLSA